MVIIGHFLSRKLFNVCGENLMLAMLLLLILAVNGGVFTGLIIHSTLNAAKIDQAISIAEKLWSMPWS